MWGGDGGRGWGVRDGGRKGGKGRREKGRKKKKNDLLSICAVVTLKRQLGKCVHLNFELAWVLCNQKFCYKCTLHMQIFKPFVNIYIFLVM